MANDNPKNDSMDGQNNDSIDTNYENDDSISLDKDQEEATLKVDMVEYDEDGNVISETVLGGDEEYEDDIIHTDEGIVGNLSEREPDDYEDEREPTESEMITFNKNMGAYTVYQNIIESIKDKNSYKAAYKKSILINVVLSGVILLFVFGFTQYPKTKYIPTKDNGAICEVYPEDNPNLTDASISEFAKDAILNLYTFDYVNYEQQMNRVLDNYFTPQGHGAMAQAMSDSQILEETRKNAWTFRASAINAVRIEQMATDKNGRTYWIVRFPMVLDIYSGGVTPIDTQRHLVTVRVSADVANVANPRGLGISSVTLEPLKK